MPTASIYTLGCRLNQAETALMADMLSRAGYELLPWGEGADLLIVNSCIVTAAAGQKTRQAMRAARRRAPDAFLVLVGCSANVDLDRLTEDGSVDMIVPNRAKSALMRHLPQPLRRVSPPLIIAVEAGRDEPFEEDAVGLYTDKTRANLKIQEGCDFFCSYCIVPYARGGPRSRRWDNVLGEAEALVARGHREIVLTGVNTSLYNDDERDLADLARAILALPGEFRIRLSSVEPGPCVPRLAEVMVEDPRLCRFLHLPLQYGEDTILQAMNRRYTVAEFADVAHTACQRVPGLCMGSDVIVGFPGETEETFAACCQAVSELPLAYLHIFSFSPREGTPAATMPRQVNGRVATERHRRLADLAQEKTRAFVAAQIGTRVDVLLEQQSDNGLWEGWSDNYLRVEVADAPAGITQNTLVAARITAHITGRRVQGQPVPL